MGREGLIGSSSSREEPQRETVVSSEKVGRKAGRRGAAKEGPAHWATEADDWTCFSLFWFQARVLAPTSLPEPRAKTDRTAASLGPG